MNIFGGIMKQEFFQAIVDGDSKAVVNLLAETPELINAVDEDGNNALMIAIKSRSANSAKIIIGTAQEKDKNNQDKKGTALKEIMQFPNNQGKTALGLLCIHQLVELPKVLEDILSEEDKKNRNLVKNLFGKWREKRADDVIQMLENDPWLIYITNNRQQNILLAAATLGRVDIVDRILDYLRANPEQIDILTMVDAEGKNVLMKAIQSDKAGKLIDILMGKTTEEQFISLLTSTDRNGNNALILACAHYNEDKEVIGKLHYFLKDKPILFEQVFYARNSSKEDALLTVIRTGKKDTLNFLLEEGIATDEMLINRLNTEGKNAFSLAVTESKEDIILYFLKSPNINWTYKMEMLRTALSSHYWEENDYNKSKRLGIIRTILDELAQSTQNAPYKERAAYVNYVKNLIQEYPYLAEGDAGALIDSNIKKVKNPPYVWALSSITIAGSACLAVEQLVGLETVVTGIAALNAGYLAATAIALVMAVAIGYGISRAVDNQLVKSFHEEQKSKTEVEELSANEL
jgi:ankyrin repeat protein